DPPGCTTAATPSLLAISTQSGKGKKASEAITAPFKSKPKDLAFSIACFSASTREVWPTPLAQGLSLLLSTMVLDLVCLQILAANTSASFSSSVGATLVTTLKSSLVSV